MEKLIYDQILQASLSFRDTIEQLDKSEFPNSSWFENFPRGCCGDTSNLLSKYLSEKGIHTLYVWGLHREKSHAWLEYDGYIIDITADQFRGVQDRVILTDDIGWHSKFIEQYRGFRDFDAFNLYNSVRLRTIYNNIISKINN